MIPPPIALALTVCERVIVEERSRNLSLVSCFSKLIVESFPSSPRHFAVVAVFRGGRGVGKLDLVVAEVETDNEIDSIHSTIEFPDRLAEVRTVFNLERCSFPAPGRYLITVLVDGEWVGHREIAVSKREIPR